MKDIVKSQVNDEYKVINGKKVKVSRRRRRSNLMTYCALAIAGFSAIGLIVSLWFLFDVKEVRISGVSLYTNDQIMLVGGVEKGANLIRTNTDIIEKRLVDTLPYVEKATVSKDYPNSIEINIVEAVKAADIELDRRYFVVSSAGDILETENLERDYSLPLVIGFQLKEPELGGKLASEDSGKAKVLMQILDSIAATRFSGITEINLTKRMDIILTYQNRIEIKVGSAIDMSYKLSSIKGIIDTKLPDDFEGTLIYNGANIGVSCISKAAQEAARNSSGQAAKNENGSLRMTTTHDFDTPAADSSTEQSGDTAQEYNGWR